MANHWRISEADRHIAHDKERRDRLSSNDQSHRRKGKTISSHRQDSRAHIEVSVIHRINKEYISTFILLLTGVHKQRKMEKHRRHWSWTHRHFDSTLAHYERSNEWCTQHKTNSVRHEEKETRWRQQQRRRAFHAPIKNRMHNTESIHSIGVLQYSSGKSHHRIT